MQLIDPVVFGATLKSVRSSHSWGSLADTAYFRACLSDHAPNAGREISLLLVGHAADIPGTLRLCEPYFSLRDSLISQLQTQRGLSHDAATWTVACWAAALGITFRPAPPSDADGSGGGISVTTQTNGALLLDIFTFGKLSGGAARIRGILRTGPARYSRSVRTAATIAVVLDALVTTVAVVALRSDEVPAGVTFFSVLLGLAIMASAFGILSGRSRGFARVLFVIMGIELLFDVIGIFTSPSFLNIAGLFLDSFAFYWCWRVLFERVPVAQNQSVNA